MLCNACVVFVVSGLCVIALFWSVDGAFCTCSSVGIVCLCVVCVFVSMRVFMCVCLVLCLVVWVVSLGALCVLNCVRCDI